MVMIDGRLDMALVPASFRADLYRLKKYLGADSVELASELDFRGRFPDCETGSMPPLGNLYGMDVFVDQALADDKEIAFNAGSHRELVRMKFADFQVSGEAGDHSARGKILHPLFFHTIFTNCCVRFSLLGSIRIVWRNALGKDMVPKKIFFTKGVGKHKERLTSFELALRDAGIAAQNLVRVSSIFPPNCKLIPRSQGLTYLSPGEVVFAVVAENSTHEPHRLLASSIGVAIPADRNTYGYLSEHHSFGETEDSAGDYAEELAAEMLATTLNVEFDSDRSWDEKKEIYRISNKIVRTANVTQSAVGDKRGLWTTVIASAVLIFD
jgi:arginine decarboxylase